MTASNFDTDVESVTRDLGMEHSISASLGKEIAGLVAERINEQRQLAKKVLEGPKDTEALLAMYRHIAVGQKVTDKQLIERYETVFAMILDHFRRAFASRPSTQNA